MYLLKKAIILSFFFLGFFLIIHRNLWLLEIQMTMPKHCHLNFKKPYEYICWTLRNTMLKIVTLKQLLDLLLLQK